MVLAVPRSGRWQALRVPALLLANLGFANFVCLFLGAGSLRTPNAAANLVLAMLLASLPLLLVVGPWIASTPAGMRWRGGLRLLALSLLFPLTLCLMLAPAVLMLLAIALVVGKWLLALFGLLPEVGARTYPAILPWLLHAAVVFAIVGSTRASPSSLGSHVRWCVLAVAHAVPAYWLLGSLLMLPFAHSASVAGLPLGTSVDAGANDVTRRQWPYLEILWPPPVQVERVTTLIPGLLEWSRTTNR